MKPDAVFAVAVGTLAGVGTVAILQGLFRLVRDAFRPRQDWEFGNPAPCERVVRPTPTPPPPPPRPAVESIVDEMIGVLRETADRVEALERAPHNAPVGWLMPSRGQTDAPRPVWGK